MTYHRTTGKGGTVDTGRDEPFPDHSKSTTRGHTAKPRRGKQKWPNRSKPRGKR